MRLNYRVQITPISAENAVDVPSIGLFGGVLTWVVNYDSIHTDANSKAGILSSGWADGFRRSAQVKRKGNTADYGGGTISIVGTAQVLRNLADLNVTIYNALITIAESRDGGAYTVIKTGIVTQNQGQLTEDKIPFNDISKSYPTTITKEIGESGSFYPVNFGVNDRAKTVGIEASFDIPLIGGRVPVFEVTSTSFGDIKATPAYFNTPTQQEVEDWADAINALIAGGNDISVSQGDNKRVVNFVNVSVAGGVVDFNWKYGDTKEDPFIVSSDVPDFVLLEPIGNTAYNDFFPGAFRSSNITSYSDSGYTPFPSFIDQTTFSNGEIKVLDNDGYGWGVVSETQSGFADYTTSPSGATVNITGDWGDVEDNDPTTKMQVDIVDGVGLIQLYSPLLRLATTTKPDKLVLSGLINLDYVVAPAGSAMAFSMIVTLRDSFGLEEATEFEFYTFGLTTQWTLLDNAIPTLYGESPTASQREKFLWESDALGSPYFENSAIGMAIDIDTSFGNQIQWETGVFCKVEFRLGKPIEGTFTGTIDFYNFNLCAKSAYTTDKLFADWKGRDTFTGGATVDTLPRVYEHALQMQDYYNRGIVTPSEGWGKAYPVVSDWSPFYDFTADYGGINNADLDSTETHFQILSESEARTDKIKAKTARYLWAIGAIGRDGVERLYPMIDGLQNDDGVQIRYTDFVEGETGNYTDRSYSDIFAAINVSYAYDAGSEKNSKSINITQVEQGSFDESYVTGVSDPVVAAELWNYGRVIYKVWSVLNEFPKEMQDCGWIQSEEQAIEYIRNAYYWQGAYQAGSLYSGRARYVARFSVPYTFGIDNGLDIGSKIQLAVPNKTYYGANEAFHSGVITSITDSVGVPNPSMTIEAEMLGDNLAGSDKTIIVQGTDSETVINQGTDSNTIIVQGA